MNNISQLKILAAGSLAFIANLVSAQTWQTVDDFQYIAGRESQAYGVVAAPSGTIFVCGNGDATSGYHGLVLAGSNGGAIGSWSEPLDDFVYPSTTVGRYEAGLACDPYGNLYVAGRGPTGVHSWVIRQGPGSGASWTTVDDFAPLNGECSVAGGLAVDAAGNVFVTGVVVYTNSPGSVWTVRKGVGGANFSTVDSVSDGSNDVLPRAVFVHPTSGAVFVAGRTNYSVTAKNRSTTTYLIWTVRRSLDGGATWETVDSTIQGEARGIGADASGNIYVVGATEIGVYTTCGPANGMSSKETGCGSHWIVRRSSDGGNSWTTVDDFCPCVTLSTHPLKMQCGAAGANAIASDSKGNLFVVGTMSSTCSSPPAPSWLVREYSVTTGTWTNVDTFQYSPNYASAAGAVAADASGNVLVAGFGWDSLNTPHWLVRKN